MAIRWKVVTEERKSLISTLAKEATYDSYLIKLVDRVTLTYTKGKTVVPDKDTLGVLTFETKKQACDFRNLSTSVTNTKIIKVRGIGKGRRIKAINGHFSDIAGVILRLSSLAYKERLEFTSGGNTIITKSSIFYGTMAYPDGVEVLT